MCRAAGPRKMVGSSTGHCGAGVSRSQAFGFGALMIGVLVFGGNFIDRLLLAGMGSAHSPCVDTEARCSTWALAGECEGNSNVRPTA